MASKFRGSQVAFNPTYFGITATSDTAGRWTANIEDIKEYYDGLQIKIVLKTSYNSTYNTLDINGLGEQLVWYRVGQRLTSHFPINSILNLTYYSAAGSYSTFTGGWVVDYSYYADTLTTNSVALFRPLAGELINPYKLGMLGLDDKFYPLTKESGTGTTKTVQTVAFKLNSPIFWFYSGGQIALGSRMPSLCTMLYDGILLYTLNQTFAAYTDLYLVGVANVDNNTFVLDNSSSTSWCTDTLPTIDDGKAYIYLGKTYSSGSYMHLFEWHPVYYYKDGALRILNTNYTPPLTQSMIGALINSATAKTTPIDADMFGLMDSAANKIMKKLSWANLKNTLKTYFDTVYTKLSFSKIRVGGVDIVASTNEDRIEFIAGTNVTLTPDTVGKKLTIAAAGGGGSATYRAIGVNFTQWLTTLQGNSIHFFGTNGVQVTPSFGGGGGQDLQLNFSLDANNLIAFLGDLPDTTDLWESGIGVSFLTYGNGYFNTPNPICGTDASSTTIEGFLTHYKYGDDFHSFTFHDVRTNIMYISSRYWDGDVEETIQKDWKRLLTCADEIATEPEEINPYEYVINSTNQHIYIDSNNFDFKGNKIIIDLATYTSYVGMKINIGIHFDPDTGNPVDIKIIDTNNKPIQLGSSNVYTDPLTIGNTYWIEYEIWNLNPYWLVGNKIYS
ncbi:MAG: hypothetical protein ACK5M0_01875 [Bacteroidales bacterium]